MENTWKTNVRKDGLDTFEHTVKSFKVFHYPLTNSVVTKVCFVVKTPVDSDDGLPHALEHLVFFGSKSQPKKGYLDQYSRSRLCSDVNAHTNHDNTCFKFAGLNMVPNGIEDVATLLLDTLLNPLMPEDAFKSEIFDSRSNSGVMYQELTEREFDIKLTAKLNAQRLLYQNVGSFNAASSGLAKNVREKCLDMDKIKAYHDRFYRPQNMSLIIVGTLDNPQYLLNRLHNILEAAEIGKSEEVPRKVLVQNDVATEISVGNFEESFILTMAWEIDSTDIDATKVLLELFRKNRDMMFSNFTYEVMQLDHGSAQVLVLFEDFEELDEAKICMQMKKSIAEYMNQVDKKLFLECIKNAMQSSGMRKLLSKEAEPHNQIMTDILQLCLYGSKPIVNNNPYQELELKDFNFWFKVAKQWARASWAAVTTTGSRKMYEKAMKSIKPPKKHHQQQPSMVDSKSLAESNCAEDLQIPEIYPKIDVFSKNTSALFSYVLVAYDVSHLSKEDADFLPLIDILIAKSARKIPNVISVQTHHIRSRHIILYAAFLHQDFVSGLREIISMFDGKSSDNADKIAAALLREIDTFEVQDLNFWRIFLRFKHYKKLLKSLEKCDEKMLDRVDALVTLVTNQVSKVRFATTDELKERSENIVRELQIKEKTSGTTYGYGHHRVNISDGIQSSHACVMMSFPKGIEAAAISISVEILNASGGAGPLWTAIRNQGLAYSCTMQTDLSENEVVLLLQDCADVIKALASIKQILKTFASLSISQEDFVIAKKCALFKYFRRFESDVAKWKCLAIEDILGFRTKDFISQLTNMTFIEWQVSQRLFSEHCTNGQNSNIVVVIPKKLVSQVHTLKGLLHHGLDLFK